MIFNSDEFKKWELVRQYNIPSHQIFRAEKYGDELTYNEITKFYRMAVEEILTFYKIKVLSDLSFGRGYFLASQRWIEKMESCIKAREKNNGR